MAQRKYIVGNWKMYGLEADLQQIALIDRAASRFANIDVAIAPPATLIAGSANAVSHIAIGAQDCHSAQQGAHTGDISAQMLQQAGASFSIVGHSERREDHGEVNADVAAKASGLYKENMQAILCVGETYKERQVGKAVESVVEMLVASLPKAAAPNWLTIAYEPVWAVGTGRVPEIAEIAEIHAAIYQQLGDISGPVGDQGWRILYGGSVKGNNAAEILAIDRVDGALVGGGSLTAEAFIPIIEAAANI